MRKRIITLMASLMVAAAIGGTALAGTTVVDMPIPEDYGELIVSVFWENAEAEVSVELIAPDGTAVGTESTPERVTRQRGGVYIYVGDARAGDWQAVVTGDDLGLIEIDAGTLPGGMFIDLFSVAASGERATVSWDIRDCPENVAVSIYAGIEREGYDGVLLGRFDGPRGTEEVSLEGLPSGEYFLFLSAITPEELFSYAYSADSVLVRRPDELLENVRAGLADDSLYISWDPTEQGDSQTYIVLVWDEEDVLLTSQVLTGDTFFLMDFPEGPDTVRVAASAYTREQAAGYTRFAVSRENPIQASVEFPEGDRQNGDYMVVTVSFDPDRRYAFDVIKNGEFLLRDEAEPGLYQIALDEGDNQIYVVVGDGQGNGRYFDKLVYVDTIPPQLAVYQDIHNTRVTQNYVYLNGYSEQGATLTLNGEPVELENGVFSLRVSLERGQNELLLVAEDVAGNQSQYWALVTCARDMSGLWGWIVAVALFVALGAVYVVIVIRNRGAGR